MSNNEPKGAKAYSIEFSGSELEPILYNIVSFIEKTMQNKNWVVSDCEATGQRGVVLLVKLNEQKTVSCDSEYLMNIFKEPGQIIELDIEAKDLCGNAVRIIVSDGCSLDVLVKGWTIPESILGKHKELDPKLFYW